MVSKKALPKYYIKIQYMGTIQYLPRCRYEACSTYTSKNYILKTSATSIINKNNVQVLRLKVNEISDLI